MGRTHVRSGGGWAHVRCTAVLCAALCYGVLGCNFQDGMKFEGEDFEILDSLPSKEACCFECRAMLGCVAFTFFHNGTEANTCVLKKYVNGTLTVAPNAVSGIATGECYFDHGVEYPLFDMMTFSDVENKETCCYWCGTTRKCAAFTYYQSGPRAKTCVVKYAVKNHISSPNMVSGVISGRSARCMFEPSTDYRGFDLKAVTGVTTRQDCCDVCRSTLNCSAFTFAPSARTCSLKSRSVNRVANGDAVSALMTGLSCAKTTIKLLGIEAESKSAIV